MLLNSKFKKKIINFSNSNSNNQFTIKSGFRWDENGVRSKFGESVFKSADFDEFEERVESLRCGQFEQILGPIRYKNIVNHMNKTVGTEDEIVAQSSAVNAHPLRIAFESEAVTGECAHTVVINYCRSAQRVDQNVIL